MRRSSSLLLCVVPLVVALNACSSDDAAQPSQAVPAPPPPEEPTASQCLSSSRTPWADSTKAWAGGGGSFGAGSGEWGGGGGLWGGGGGFWGGGGGWWGGGGGQWGGGGGQWGGGGGYWGGGGGWWGGGGGNWGGGGGNWGGGGGNWGGGGGLWGGGFASTFPFLGWSNARHWHFRGVPQQGYVASSDVAISGDKDTKLCPAGQVRLGGFAYGIDVESWPAYVTLGYHAKLCVPTPGGEGLTMNATAGDPSTTQLGGYKLSRTLTNAGADALAMKSMVGWGAANVATQYAGALCASIGSLAAAKRSCGVGIAMSDPNRNPDGTLSQRGAAMRVAQDNAFTMNTPFGRAQGHALYGEAPNDMESYASHVLQRHATVNVPEAPSGIGDWNNAHKNGFDFNGKNFGTRSVVASDNAKKLFADANRSLKAPLNMIPVDANDSENVEAGNVVLLSDMDKSLSAANGDLYALSLHSLAFNQSPLYGSGGGRWFFHTPSTADAPLMDLSSVFQGSTYVLTGQLDSGTAGPNDSLLRSPYISQLTLAYADWRRDTGAGLFIDRAGQLPQTVESDNDREARLAAALRLPRVRSNIGGGTHHTCAIASTGGGLKCWGYGGSGNLGDGLLTESSVPVNPVGMESGVLEVTGSLLTTCALSTDGRVRCWGANIQGELGNGADENAIAPTPEIVPGLAGVTSISAGAAYFCAVLSHGAVKCWGDDQYGQLGNGISGEGQTFRSPQDVMLYGRAVAVSAAYDHTCALMDDGTVMCWGANDYGGLGDGTTNASSVPVRVVGLDHVVQIATSWTGTCAVKSDQSLWCWGPLMATGMPDVVVTSVPLEHPTLRNVASVVSNGAAVHTCAVLVGGDVSCWGLNFNGQLGTGNTDDSFVPVRPNLAEPVSSIAVNAWSTCARLRSGGVQCWGENSWGQLGDGTTTTSYDPVNVVGDVNNANLIASQGSVLINKYDGASGQVAGHILPIPYSMVNTESGSQALIVTYDPLAVAAAEFIEQYDAHIAACAATTDETDIVEDDGDTFTNGQKQGKRLWACSNACAKESYLRGMKTFLNGARSYLFGRVDGCIQSDEVVEGSTCNETKIDWSQAHTPYTLWVPDYKSAEFHSEYANEVAAAAADYSTRLIAAGATRIERTLQLANVAKFTTNTAIVSSRVTRSGNYGSECIANEGFVWK